MVYKFRLAYSGLPFVIGFMSDCGMVTLMSQKVLDHHGRFLGARSHTNEFIAQLAAAVLTLYHDEVDVGDDKQIVLETV